MLVIEDTEWLDRITNFRDNVKCGVNRVQLVQ